MREVILFAVPPVLVLAREGSLNGLDCCKFHDVRIKVAEGLVVKWLQRRPRNYRGAELVRHSKLKASQQMEDVYGELCRQQSIMSRAIVL